MASITKSPKITEKIMKIIKGKKGSPYKTTDDLGKVPDYRNPKDLPGTEIKKLKEAGKKIEEFFKSNPKKFGSGGAVCKLATKGKGRAYGKNS
tara:strand:- start:43 stop:321 length:279 start_codon:yes stop_codon:yes gene_type:complete